MPVNEHIARYDDQGAIPDPPRDRAPFIAACFAFAFVIAVIAGFVA